MNKPKFILLNGFAGSGKTTIARMYADEHPMTLMIEGDELIVNIGDWLKHESEARELVYEMTKAMARTYLSSGHDVILPYLVQEARHVENFERIAHELGADFYEFVLHNDRSDAIARLLKRGTWGEAGLPPLGDKDTPVIEKLIDRMQTALEKRPNIIVINQREGNPNHTYQQLIRRLN